MTNISINNLAKAIYESSKNLDENETSRLSKKIVNFLSEKRLLNKSKEILNKLQKIVDKDNSTLRFKITSSIELDDKNKKELDEFIKHRYKIKNAILNFNNDPNLIGGIKIEKEDEIIDITLKNKINKLKNYLLTN